MSDLLDAVDRSWKDTGSYMVWNDNELQLSPAFTRHVHICLLFVIVYFPLSHIYMYIF